MIKIILSEENYNNFEDGRNYLQELIQREKIELDDITFIEEIFSMLESNIEF